MVGKLEETNYEQYHRCQTTTKSKIKIYEGDISTKFNDLLIRDVAGKGTVLGGKQGPHFLFLLKMIEESGTH